MSDWITVVLTWEMLKTRMGEALDLSQPVLHVIIGVAIYLVSVPLLRARVGDWRPLIPVALAEAANETLDFLRYWYSGWPWSAPATISDVLLTLVPPLAIIVFVRARRWHRAARG